jgi:hypothetical protein
MPDPQNHPSPSTTPPAWLQCLAIGLAAAICAVIGHNIYVCDGIARGIVFIIALPLVFLFVPKSLIGFLSIVAAVTASIRSLPANSVFSKHLIQLTVYIAVASLLMANVLSYALGSSIKCSLGGWT